MHDSADRLPHGEDTPHLAAASLGCRRALLDRVTRRWQDGKRPLLRIEARPGQGKSVFAAQLAEHLGLPARWYRLTPRDRDARTLSEGLLAAARKDLPGCHVARAERSWSPARLAQRAAEELGIALRDDGTPRPLPRLRTLGGLELAAGDRAILRRHEFTEAQRELLGRLAATPGLEAGQETLQSQQWPASPARRARSALNTAVSRLRKRLEDAAGAEVARDHLIVKNGIVRLENVLLDASEFEDRVREGLRLAERGRLWAATLALRSGLDLWQGDFLAGISLEGEAEARRLSVRTLHLRGARRLARILLDRGEEDEAVEVLEHAVCHHPLDPDLSGALHDIWARRDRPKRAVEVLNRFRQSLAEAGYSDNDLEDALARLTG